MIYDESYYVYKDLLNFDEYINGSKSDDEKCKFNDIWRFNCPEDDPNCKIIKEYKEDNKLNNYENCTVKGENLKDTAEFYLDKFYNFNLDCDEQLKNIMEINEEYKIKLDNISTIAEYSLYNAKNITFILNDVFNQYVSNDNNILDILNCRFLQRDKNIILSELDSKFTSNVTKMSTDILTIACAMALGTFFLLIVINRYVDDKKKPSKKKVKKIIVQEKEVENNSDTVIENDDTVENV